MIKNNMRYLVFGSDGYIGSYIYRRLKQDGFEVLGTSRRIVQNKEHVFFDILKSDIKAFVEKYSTQHGVAVFCIAESNITRCYENFDVVYQINVTKTKELIYNLIQNGYKVIFFSSDNVFNGIKGNYKENDTRAAINRYGQMKIEIEDYMLDNNSGVVFRISKAIGDFVSNHNIFSEWEKQNEMKKNIYCIRGNILSFVFLEDIYQLCLLVKPRQLSGLYNICGDKSYSRKELATLFFKIRGKRDVEIIELEKEVFGFVDGRPLNISMDNSKIIQETDYQFTSMKKVIKKYMKNVRHVSLQPEVE